VSAPYDDSDEATGLPSLTEVDPHENGLHVTSWEIIEGISVHPHGEDAVVFVNVRGLMPDDRSPHKVGWGQAHIAIPRDRLEDFLVALASV